MGLGSGTAARVAGRRRRKRMKPCRIGNDPSPMPVVAVRPGRTRHGGVGTDVGSIVTLVLVAGDHRRRVLAGPPASGDEDARAGRREGRRTALGGAARRAGAQPRRHQRRREAGAGRRGGAVHRRRLPDRPGPQRRPGPAASPRPPTRASTTCAPRAARWAWTPAPSCRRCRASSAPARSARPVTSRSRAITTVPRRARPAAIRPCLCRLTSFNVLPNQGLWSRSSLPRRRPRATR